MPNNVIQSVGDVDGTIGSESEPSRFIQSCERGLATGINVVVQRAVTAIAGLSVAGDHDHTASRKNFVHARRDAVDVIEIAGGVDAETERVDTGGNGGDVAARCAIISNVAVTFIAYIEVAGGIEDERNRIGKRRFRGRAAIARVAVGSGAREFRNDTAGADDIDHGREVVRNVDVALGIRGERTWRGKRRPGERLRQKVRLLVAGKGLDVRGGVGEWIVDTANAAGRCVRDVDVAAGIECHAVHVTDFGGCMAAARSPGGAGRSVAGDGADGSGGRVHHTNGKGFVVSDIDVAFGIDVDHGGMAETDRW